MQRVSRICSAANMDCKHYEAGLCTYKGICPEFILIDSHDAIHHRLLDRVNFNYLVKSLENQKEILQNQARILSLLEKQR